MFQSRLISIAIILATLLVGYFIYASEPKWYGGTKPFGADIAKGFPFKLGLDLSGGTHLVYRADVTRVAEGEVKDSIEALRDVIERRVNLFGVAEPIVQSEKSRLAGGEERLIVELPGVTDVNQAVSMIGQTPLLEFKTERPLGPERDAIIKAIEAFQAAQAQGETPVISPLLLEDPYYLGSPLTGRFLEKATLEFDTTTGEPKVGLQFNGEGADLFASLTKENVGKTVAVYLDGAPISAPVVREEILGGRAEISGNFTAQEAKQLVGRLNSGALPVPIELIGTQSISAPLGEKALASGLRAGIYGLLIIAVFLILWYRLPGLIAVLALCVYVAIMLAIFKFVGITLTAAGIAGLILSIGMAVDANILVAERMKEELRRGRGISDAIHEGFSRAWFSIRDSNISSILTGVILFWFGTSLIEGFALTFTLGVVVSMFSALTVTRTFLFSLGFAEKTSFTDFMFSSGFRKN